KLNGLIYARNELRAATDRSKASESFDRRRFSGVDCRRGHYRHPVIGGLRDVEFVFRRPAGQNPSVNASAPHSSGGEAEHRASSIIVETDRKGRCEEHSFDNRTGKIVSSNYCGARHSKDNALTGTPPSEAQSFCKMKFFTIG